MDCAIYKPLDPAGGHIRLLVIQPAKVTTAPIHCELSYVRLPSRPAYEALSYTWGSAKPHAEIILDGQPFETYQNLSAALHRLRRPKTARIFWIDAICINQKDQKEKEQQVVQMKQIYQQAAQVVIWLGETDTGGRAGMRSFATEHFSLTNSTSMFRMQSKHGVGRTLRERWAAAAVGEIERFQEVEVGEVSQLLDRPWWQRVWIVQEAVLARKAVIMCGPDEVPWDAIAKRLRSDGVYGLRSLEASQPLRVYEGTIIEGGYHFPDAEYRVLSDLQQNWSSGEWKTSLYDLMYRFRRLGCSNPRDRVYGF